MLRLLLRVVLRLLLQWLVLQWLLCGVRGAKESLSLGWGK